MKKTFFYNFFPTKEEEDEAKAKNMTHQVTKTLVEVGDLGADPIDHHNPPKLKKVLNATEIVVGKLILNQTEMFQYVFRHWSLEMANHVVSGKKYKVALIDYTDETNPRKYQGDDMFVEKGHEECYVIGMEDLFLARFLRAEDEIVLWWDVRSATFHVKFLRKGGH